MSTVRKITAAKMHLVQRMTIWLMISLRRSTTAEVLKLRSKGCLTLTLISQRGIFLVATISKGYGANTREVKMQTLQTFRCPHNARHPALSKRSTNETARDMKKLIRNIPVQTMNTLTRVRDPNETSARPKKLIRTKITRLQPTLIEAIATTALRLT
jgi:hypothetical protein